ncbi:type II toxin-antitoxin system VapC family toxin [Nitrococcus mobilis]|uniref:PilT protein-like n=1 Tax=Nitrococcus mobilis Nb-231 TaxID=314278 RepID=A4BUA4_9GAMM|nr:PilT protein-like [Nitrococcus mobilis Nb-231]
MLLSDPGAERVRTELPGAIMTTVNLGEVVGHYARNGVAETDIHAVLDPLPIERITFDEELAYGAGLLLPVTKPFGLSFGDRACLALAQRRGARVLTSDKAWRGIVDIGGAQIELIR